jgi:hypothetical protein
MLYTKDTPLQHYKAPVNKKQTHTIPTPIQNRAHQSKKTSKERRPATQ